MIHQFVINTLELVLPKSVNFVFLNVTYFGNNSDHMMERGKTSDRKVRASWERMEDRKNARERER